MNSDYKYRPKSIDEFVFTTPELKEVISTYTDHSTLRPLVLHGPHGTGKSLLTELIPKTIDGPNVSVSRLTVDDLKTRKSISENLVRTAVFDSMTEPVGQTYYYTVLDECQFDSKVLNDAVRLSLDKMQGRGLYIFATNDLGKIDSGVIDRSTCVHVPPISPEAFLPWALHILESEGIEAPPDAILDILLATHKRSQSLRAYYEAIDLLIYRANRR